MKSQNKNTKFNIALSSPFIINIDLRRGDKKNEKKYRRQILSTKINSNQSRSIFSWVQET